MGWDFIQGATKTNIVKELTAKAKANALKGNVLWTIEEMTKMDGTKTPIICCYLLDKEKGLGWGYKGMDESLEPYYYDCPLEFLDTTPVVKEGWREKVRAFHAGTL